MAPYHHMLAHFPVALLALAMLIVMYRGFTDRELAKRLDCMLPYVLALGLAGGLVTFVSGLMIWPLDAAIGTPMGRNKILTAAWMLAAWTAVLALRWRGGESIWQGHGRFSMLALSASGGILLAVTGTLGGHLLGSPSRLSGGLRALGFDVYQTYYVPTWVIAVMLVTAAAMIAIGFVAMRGRRSAAAAN